MPWQKHVLDTALEVGPDGNLRYPVVVVTVPRQAGKTTLLRPVFARACLERPDASTWLTAQRRDDARDTWQAMVKVLERSPLARLAKVRRANGSESVTFANGSELRIFAPAEDALHGKTTRLVAVDEVWAFSALAGKQLMQAIVPTQATQPGAQVWLVSTAGSARSQWLRELVDTGRASSGRSGGGMAYFEWSVPEDADLADPDVFARHHPALHRTITPGALAAAREVMAPAEFARAYGNVWTTTDRYAIAPELWDSARTRLPLAPGSPVAFAAETSADRSESVIAAAGYLSDGRAAFEVVERRGGVGWAGPRLAELTARHRPLAVVVDPMSPARPIWSHLAERHKGRIPLAEFGAAELIAAQTEMLDGFVGRTAAHRAHDALDAACQAASSRTVREVEVLSRQVAADGSSPAALLAGMLALWGLAHPLADTRPAVRTASAGL